MQLPTSACVLILWTFVFKYSHQHATKYRNRSGNFTGSCATQINVDTNIGCLSICKAKGCQVSTYFSDIRVCHVYNNVTLHANGTTPEHGIMYVKDVLLEEHLKPKVSKFILFCYDMYSCLPSCILNRFSLTFSMLKFFINVPRPEPCFQPER